MELICVDVYENPSVDSQLPETSQVTREDLMMIKFRE